MERSTDCANCGKERTVVTTDDGDERVVCVFCDDVSVETLDGDVDE